MLTPRKRLGSDMDGAPRRINALINLTYTSLNSADTVVEELKRVFEEKKIPFKQTDYLLRCKISDDWGRIRFYIYNESFVKMLALAIRHYSLFLRLRISISGCVCP